MKEKTSKTKVSIIGAGRVGMTIAYYLTQKRSKKNIISAVSSKTQKSLKKAKEILDSPNEDIFFTLNNAEAAQKADCVLICTPDDLIEAVCSEIFERQDADPKKYSVIHFSGSKRIEVLEAAAKRGAHIGCAHPIKSFASFKQAAQSLKGTTYGLTFKTKKAEKILKDLINDLEGKHIIVKNEAKPLYHAMTCITSNFLVGLIDFALSLSEQINIPSQDLIEPLLNLSEGTIANMKKMGSKKALTGPIARGDTTTVLSHIESLQKNMQPEDVDIYKVLGRHTSKISFYNKWIGPKKYKEFAEILK